MPEAETAPPAPAVDLPGPNDPAAIPLPGGDGSAPRTDLEVTVSGIPLAAAGWWALLVTVYGYALPFALYAAWLSVAFWDLARRDDVPVAHRAAWMGVVLVVPILGPIAYFVLGRSPIPGALRLMLVAGGLAAYVLFAGVSFLLAAL
jgi:hypothetical protein